MDTVRFGRALGIGARAAAKSLAAAADAATSPAPTTTPPSRAEQAGRTAAQTARQTTQQAKLTAKGLQAGSKRFGQAIWSPLLHLSGVLWLEVTGAFFAIFALFAASQAWKLRTTLQPLDPHRPELQHLAAAIAMALLFTYFSVSSFLRANRKQR